MNEKIREAPFLALRLILGFVILFESVLFLFGAEAGHAGAARHLPAAVRLGLGWSEVLASVLFLLPPTVTIGGWSLIAVFCGAAFIHLAHGDFGIGGLLIDAAAVLVVIEHRRLRAGKHTSHIQ
jgi:hypothetical protein